MQLKLILMLFLMESRVVIGGIMEHIEQAGVHSGDSACSLPPYSIDEKKQNELISQTKKMASKA